MNIYKRIGIFLTAFSFCLILISSAKAQNENSTTAELVTTMGTIKLKLYTDKAPITTQNFINLINQGFYNGIIFHRAIEDFVIQGGDPTGKGTGGSKNIITDEFNNGLKHNKPGILSMANRGPNTATSQFFITLDSLPHIDGKFTVFGEVAEGMDVVYAISQVETDEKDRPLVDVKIITASVYGNNTNVQSETSKVAMLETTLGTIKIKLFTTEAPITTQNFIDLVNKGFYDGIIFHRVIDGFMIQGGDPTGTGMGGSGKKIPDEFGPGLKHSKAGILSMANAGPNTGESQFFITLAAFPHLDGRHAVFGEVIEGMEVVSAIGKVKTGVQDRPIEEVKIIKATISE